ncbi:MULTISPECIES: hypothetical protein [Rhizobium]|uniref:hypothetical protein n=1 Tax=Rhizobium TaxID=379 RepID=UPI00040192DC|nr:MULTISPECIES: hypothetical protein [Rhizobium]MCA0801645.1 hypothetical protein [Rhizobium sp. T1473]MCS0462735.1 hypothetical protein [Rhizobium favelukesii]UFS80963.1 hypothetical protein LPB79_21800 [Rhizobium sp. T136]
METLEHLDRRSDGGSNRRSRLALACFDCNFGRGSMDWLIYKTIKSGELFDIIMNKF